MATARQQSVTFRDAKGHTATLKFYVNGTTPALLASNAAGIITAFAALSNCAIQAQHGPESADPIGATYGTNATYASVEDKAVLTYQDPKGLFHRFKVPAPIASIFLTDGETVDPANTNIIALNTAQNGVMVTADGLEPFAFIGGVRTRVKIRRKATILTKDPALTGPEE